MLIVIKPFLHSVTAGMPKEKYDPPDTRRMYTIMSTEEAANGKKSYWAELEITGEHCRGVAQKLWRGAVLILGLSK